MDGWKAQADPLYNGGTLKLIYKVDHMIDRRTLGEIEFHLDAVSELEFEFGHTEWNVT